MTYFTTAHSDCVKCNTKKKGGSYTHTELNDSRSFTFNNKAHIL